MKKILILALSACVLASELSSACIHFPSSFSGELTEGRRKAFLFHDGTDAHLVIETSLRAEKFPSEIAWVLPFPSLPSKYEEIDGPVFEELNSIVPSSRMMKGASDSIYGGAQGVSGIKVHDLVVTDHYQIQPIEILKDGSAQEFNAWLQANKFNPMPYENQKYYLKKGATFLAIRMKMNKPLAGELRSKPLHVVYRASDLTFPLKFTHDYRRFDLDLFVFTKKELRKNLGAQFLRLDASHAYSAKQGHFPFVDALIGKQEGFMTRYVGEGINSQEKQTKSLMEDPSFHLADLR